MNKIFERAKQIIPGGVNSPVRSFLAVGRDPLFIKSAQGSKIYDTDNNEYIDYVCSWGPMILGHAHPEILASVVDTARNGLSFGAPTTLEVDMAEFIIEHVPNIDMVRMVNSGTEAVMSALRLARGYTGRKKIIKFDGCYHGHSDGMLVKAGSGVLTLSHPDSLGVTAGTSQDTLIAQYNYIQSVKVLFEQNPQDIAAVIIEPVAANMGVVLPNKEFLTALRELCDAQQALLIFDEVITGFRLALGGAQEYLGIRADIVTFGKIIGGGMPVGAYAGSKKIMELVAPKGGVYQAGTLSGNPVAMAAGLKQLQLLKQDKNIYKKLESKASLLASGLRAIATELDIPVQVNNIGSLVCVFFTQQSVVDFASAKSSNTALYAKYFRLMLDNGINLAPAQFEAMFVSAAHSDQDLQATLSAASKVLKTMKEQGDFA